MEPGKMPKQRQREEETDHEQEHVHMNGQNDEVGSQRGSSPTDPEESFHRFSKAMDWYCAPAASVNALQWRTSSLLEMGGRDSFLIIMRVAMTCQASGSNVRIIHRRVALYHLWVLLLDMMDNSTRSCKLISVGFYPHLTIQAGCCVL
jgi:hypothetical protein